MVAAPVAAFLPQAAGEFRASTSVGRCYMVAIE